MDGMASVSFVAASVFSVALNHFIFNYLEYSTGAKIVPVKYSKLLIISYLAATVPQRRPVTALHRHILQSPHRYPVTS
jgi:hypothetical protein